MAKQHKNTRETAVALRYKEDVDNAPRVVAKGFGLVAEHIMEMAQKCGIPIRQDSDLVELLAQLDVDREIPAQLYAAVAEVLAMVYKANNSMETEGAE